MKKTPWEELQKKKKKTKERNDRLPGWHRQLTLKNLRQRDRRMARERIGAEKTRKKKKKLRFYKMLLRKKKTVSAETWKEKTKKTRMPRALTTGLGVEEEGPTEEESSARKKEKKRRGEGEFLK